MHRPCKHPNPPTTPLPATTFRNHGHFKSSPIHLSYQCIRQPTHNFDQVFKRIQPGWRHVAPAIVQPHTKPSTATKLDDPRYREVHTLLHYDLQDLWINVSAITTLQTRQQSLHCGINIASRCLQSSYVGSLIHKAHVLQAHRTRYGYMLLL